LQVSTKAEPSSRRRLLRDSYPLIQFSDEYQPNVKKQAIKSSSIRLSTNLNNDTTLRMTHRIDISKETYDCTDCGARDAGGDIVLPNGHQANSVLLQLYFKGGHILQKYYTLQIYAGNTTVDPGEVSYESTGSQIYDVTLIEQSGWLKDLMLHTSMGAKNVFPFQDPKYEFHAFAQLFVVVISVLFATFLALFVMACIDEHRPAGYFNLICSLFTHSLTHARKG